MYMRQVVDDYAALFGLLDVTLQNDAVVVHFQYLDCIIGQPTRRAVFV
jgi:hypothetical protein